MSAKTNSSSFIIKGLGNPGPGQYDVSDKMRSKTSGGNFGIKTGSAFGTRPLTASHVGPGSYMQPSVSLNNSKS